MNISSIVLIFLGITGALSAEPHGDKPDHKPRVRPRVERAETTISNWEKNYQHLVKLLMDTKEVSNCAVSLSKDPDSPEGSWTVNILRNPGGIKSFQLEPPKKTNGATQVDFTDKNTIRYRQSDPVGWSNLVLRVDESKRKIISIEMNMTLPNGKIYHQGAKCGVALGKVE